MVVLPYAGGGPDAYADLAAHLPPEWAVVSGEVTDRDGGVDPLAEAWWTAIAADLVPGSVLYGHSLGACVALTLAAWRAVELRGVTVVLSGLPLSGPATAAGELEDAQLLIWMRAHGALPDVDMTDQELVRLVLPRFRRDLKGMHGSWSGLVPEGPVHLVTGSADVLCRPEQLRTFGERWPQAELHVVEGVDHRLPTSGAKQLCGVLLGAASPS
jgi:surfactin synthase thioesterase subunit